MTLELIATESLILAHAAGSPISGGTFTVTSIPDPNVSAESNAVFFNQLQFTFSGGSAAGFVSGSVATTAPATIPATAYKVKNASGFIMREGDQVTMDAVGALPGGGTSAVAGPVEIQAAGQTTVSAQ